MSAQNQDAQLLMNAQRLRAGLLLAIVGAVIGTIGSIFAGVELAQATRKWFNDAGYPDSAREKVHQAVLASRAATHAAMDAWQHDGHLAGAESGNR